MKITVEITWNKEMVQHDVRANGKLVAACRTEFMAQEYARMIEVICKLAGIECEVKEGHQ